MTTHTSEVSASDRLPSGRASRAAFSREDVARHQRRRLLRSMAEVVAEVGYGATTVSAVIARAGVSRATFYQQFADKQECFFAAYDVAVEVLLSGVDTAGVARNGRSAFPELLASYLDTLVENELFTRVFLLEAYAVGAPAVVRRAEGQKLFVDVLAGLFGASSAADRFACEALVAAVASMVTARLAARDPDGIRALHGPLVSLSERLLPG